MDIIFPQTTSEIDKVTSALEQKSNLGEIPVLNNLLEKLMVY